MFRVLSLALAGFLLVSSSCASIVSKSRYPLTITSSPERANIMVTDKRGRPVYQGVTPATLNLSASSGFFSKAEYQITFQKEGYAQRILPIRCELDGWYFGNLLFGGLIGFLIVDPITGAMFRLQTNFITTALQEGVAATEREQLKVYALDEVPAEWRAHLVEIGE